jgi:hypothetical protein
MPALSGSWSEEMKAWAKLFKSYSGSGVYKAGDADLDEIERQAISRGLAFFKVDLSGTAGKEGFLRVVAQALEFPSYFGMNWDAFEECINDMEWHPADGYVIVLQALEAFSRNAPGDFKLANSIFKTAAKDWKTKRKPFYVIMDEK